MPFDAPAERRAHAADLSVQTLRQHDAKRRLSRARDDAGLCFLAADPDARGHHRQKRVRDRGLDRDGVFLFVAVLDTKDLVHDVAVVGQEDQALRVLVEPPDRKNPLAVPDEVDDVVGDIALGRAGDSAWLVEGDIDVFPAGG